MILDIAVIAGLTFVKWIVYTALLWGMIKLQKLQYNMLGLMGSSALAILLQFVPVVGCYISWAALILCLWKVTHADIAPEVLFTVAIPGAIMFCLNLWGFAALMGELRPDLKVGARHDSPVIEEFADEDEAPSAPSGPAKAIAAVHDLARKIADRAQTNSETPPAKTAAAAPASPRRLKPLGNGSAQGIYLKGIVLNSQRPTAMIMANGKFYTVGQGEAVSFPSANGRISLRCNSIEKSGVAVTLNGSEELILRVQ